MKKFPFKNLKEFKIFKKYNTPWKIQDFLDTIPINFEIGKETYFRPLQTLQQNRAHCMEGALLGAAMLWYHGFEPVIIHLRTSKHEPEDHIITLFRINGLFGALSKTNHNIVRYRDPVYATERELVMSYFNEYFTSKGIKSLRSYSEPFSLLKYPDTWVIDESHTWDILEDINNVKHHALIPKKVEKVLRKVDKIELQNSTPTEWSRPKNNKTWKKNF